MQDSEIFPLLKLDKVCFILIIISACTVGCGCYINSRSAKKCPHRLDSVKPTYLDRS